MKKFFILFSILVLLWISSCAPTVYPYAGVSVLSGVECSASKTGVAGQLLILGFIVVDDNLAVSLFTGGNMGVGAAASNGDIIKICYVDRSFKIGLLGLWVERQTIVYGE